ncbi:hypothetical protein Dtox_2659 [Desulfofarcimen acetoxidans DSM 771]|uniref:Uncharacterized protein n=2 Tax=Desulfofarcimen acetoxidans TaxID=58138 RepID=C8W145_DESAS|nr:hypothetical protein Dtox_2659 [Desulfofarcimen acetoxidans DSM 771]
MPFTVFKCWFYTYNPMITSYFMTFTLCPSVVGKTLSIDEAVDLYKNKISLSISCGLFVDCENNNLSESQLDRLYSIIRALKNKNFENISLKIRYFNEEHKNEVEKDPDRFLYAEASYYRELKNKNIILFQIKIEDIESINQLGDIVNYIQE